MNKLIRAGIKVEQKGFSFPKGGKICKHSRQYILESMKLFFKKTNKLG